MMTHNYYSDPVFPGASMPSGTPNQQMAPTMNNPIEPGGMLPLEQSYIENILRANKGRLGKFFMSFPDSVEWRDKIFTGIIEAAGRGHLIISDPNTGIRHLLRMIYLDYVDFQEPISYGVGTPR
jgi:spore germination protein Q